MKKTNFKSRISRLRIFVLVLGVLAATIPTSAGFVERAYSVTFYPLLQRYLTSLTNQFQFALFDLLVVALVGVFVVWWVVSIKSGRTWATLAGGSIYDRKYCGDCGHDVPRVLTDMGIKLPSSAP